MPTRPATARVRHALRPLRRLRSLRPLLAALLLVLCVKAPVRAAGRADTLYPTARFQHRGPCNVAIDGDTLAFGTFISGADEPGKVWIYRRDAAGVWQLEAVVRGHGAIPQDQPFGESLALSGNTLAVGAPPYSVYVFVRRPATGWEEQQQIPAVQSESSPNFGWSLAVAGRHLLIGGPSLAAEQPDVSGAVYAYLLRGGAWQPDGVFAGAGDPSYGTTLSLSGNLAAAGNTSGSPIDILLSGPQGWAHQAAPPTGDDATTFLSLSGNTLAVIASITGTASIWTFSPGDGREGSGSWRRDATLAMKALELALDGDLLAATTPANTVQVYQYNAASGAWIATATLKEPAAEPVPGFGRSLALSQGTAVVSTNNPVWVFNLASGR